MSTFFIVSEANYRRSGICMTKNEDVRDLCGGTSDFQNEQHGGEEE